MQINVSENLKFLVSALLEVSPDSYIIGGALRDSHLGLPVVDIDIATSLDGFDIAAELHAKLRDLLAFVPLDQGNGTARLVFRKSQEIIDISQFKGSTIEEDLTNRDFTINAMAMHVSHLFHEHPEIIDPLHGFKDLTERIVRVCSSRSFIDDPLRILRAFRFAAALEMRIDPGTRIILEQSIPDISRISGERIRNELFVILGLRNSYRFVMQMDDCGLLDQILPHILPMKSCDQNRYHHLDVWNHTLEAYKQFEEIIGNGEQVFGKYWPEIADYLNGEFVPGRTVFALLKLAVLYHDSGKPDCRFVDDQGRIRFFGHEKESFVHAIEMADKLKLSVKEKRFIGELVKIHMQPAAFTQPAVQDKTVNRFIRKLDRDLIGMLLLFLSDLKATQGPARKPGEDAIALGNVKHAFELLMFGEKPVEEPLLSGKDLQNLFGMDPGPRMGELLSHLSEMQEEGRISNFQQACILADEWLKKPD